MNVDIHIEDNSDRVLDALDDAMGRALEKIGLVAEGHAKLELENEPRRIDTGRLRNSISHAVREDTAYIGTNVEYGIYVHEGTDKMKPNRFLRNAAANNIEEYRKIVREEMKK